MSNLCLPAEVAERLIEAVKDGKIVNSELLRATPEARTSFFAEIVGKENAKEVNLVYEKKVLLKDQQQALLRTLQTVKKPKEYKDKILARIEKLDKILDKTEQDNFFRDLAQEQLGYGVTYDEAVRLTEMTRKIRELEEVVKNNPSNKTRQEYGNAYVILDEYVRGLQLKPRGIKNYWKDVVDGDLITVATKLATKPTGDVIRTVGGVTKGTAATFDFSALLRQGYKLLTNNPTVWARSSLTPFTSFFKEISGKNALHEVRAEIVSRPNAINGKYRAMKADLGLLNEEAFPDNILNRLPEVVNKLPGGKLVQWPLKLPAEGLSRVYRGFEAAYTGTILRMRADYADMLIREAERAGVNMMDRKSAEPIGMIVNEMTGRGHLEFSKSASEFTNVTLFSPRFWKAQIDFLTMHAWDYRKMEQNPGLTFARKRAALNLARTVAVTASVMYTASKIWGEDAIEWDPRSSDFGKLKINKTRFDISGGLSTHVVLASRITMDILGKEGYKSTKTGKLTDLSEGGYFLNLNTVIADYFTNRASPTGSMFLARNRGEFRDGEEFTYKGAAQRLLTPIPFQTAQELSTNPDAAPFLWALIAEELGIGVNTY